MSPGIDRLEMSQVYSKNSAWVKSVFTPAAARTPSAAAIIIWAGLITEASPAAYIPLMFVLPNESTVIPQVDYIHILIVYQN
jgi:hypothetical protein